ELSENSSANYAAHVSLSSVCNFQRTDEINFRQKLTSITNQRTLAQPLSNLTTLTLSSSEVVRGF
ncbi:hypothetical protein, partial [Paenochrobactrum glaciei]|uniref:hypothetical protein n=1 Tax=Paenochrobactrum glaciei TaxID=486407 RepID=UPI0031E35A90